MNSDRSKYSQRFRKIFRNTFKVNDKVYIRSTSLESQDKINNLFDKEEIIQEVLENDSYLIKFLNSLKTIKKNHSQIIKIL